MLPLIPILLIAKLSIALAATEGFIDEKQLNKLLRDLRKMPPEQLGIDSAVGLLAALHIILVLLQAANNELEQDPGDATHEVIKVAAYPPDIYDPNNPDTSPLIKSKGVIINLEDTSQYDNLLANIRDVYSKSLRTCFEYLAELPEPFDLMACLNNCAQPAQVRRRGVFNQAMELIKTILLSSDIRQVKGLLNINPKPLEDMSTWLNQRYDLNLQFDLSAIHDAGKQAELSRLNAMIMESHTFYVESISRIKNSDTPAGPSMGNDVLTAVSGFGHDDDWQNLRSALFGIICWQMLDQIHYVSVRLKALI